MADITVTRPGEEHRLPEVQGEVTRLQAALKAIDSSTWFLELITISGATLGVLRFKRPRRS